MKKTFLIFLLFISNTGWCQQFFLAVPFHSVIDSIYYRSTTTWIIPTPVFITTQRFSMDKGITLMRAGLMGERLNKYVYNIPKAKRNLRSFQITRAIGLAQAFIIAPIFLKKEIDWVNYYNSFYGPPYPDIKGPPYMAYFFGFLFTGAITYHFISKPFFKRSLKEYHKLHRLDTWSPLARSRYLPECNLYIFDYKANCDLRFISLFLIIEKSTFHIFYFYTRAGFSSG